MYKKIEKYPKIEVTFENPPKEMNRAYFSNLITSTLNKHPELKGKILNVEIK